MPARPHDEHPATARRIRVTEWASAAAGVGAATVAWSATPTGGTQIVLTAAAAAGAWALARATVWAVLTHHDRARGHQGEPTATPHPCEGPHR